MTRGGLIGVIARFVQNRTLMPAVQPDDCIGWKAVIRLDASRGRGCTVSGNADENDPWARQNISPRSATPDGSAIEESHCPDQKKEHLPRLADAGWRRVAGKGAYDRCIHQSRNDRGANRSACF